MYYNQTLNQHKGYDYKRLKGELDVAILHLKKKTLKHLTVLFIWLNI